MSESTLGLGDVRIPPEVMKAAESGQPFQASMAPGQTAPTFNIGGPPQPAQKPFVPDWKDVASSPKYQGMTEEQKTAVRNQYFVDFVAPNVPTEKLAAVKASFDAEAVPSAPGFWEKAKTAVGKAVETLSPSGSVMDKMDGKKVEPSTSTTSPALRQLIQATYDKLPADKREQQAMRINPERASPAQRAFLELHNERKALASGKGVTPGDVLGAAEVAIPALQADPRLAQPGPTVAAAENPSGYAATQIARQNPEKLAEALAAGPRIRDIMEGKVVERSLEERIQQKMKANPNLARYDAETMARKEVQDEQAGLREPVREGGKPVSGTFIESAQKGGKSLKLTWDFLADSLAGSLGADQTDTRRILQESAKEFAAMQGDARIMDAAGKAEKRGKDMLGTIAYFPAEVAKQDDPLGLVANFMAEQLLPSIPGFAMGAAVGGPVGGFAVNRITQSTMMSLTAQAALRAGLPMAAAGAAGNGMAVVTSALGSNYSEGLQKFKGDVEKAKAYAVTKTLNEVPANALAGAFMGVKIGPNQLTNIVGQAFTQGAGGAAGAAQASLSVGEKVDSKEVAAEFWGEFAGAPGEIAMLPFESKTRATSQTPVPASQAAAPDAGKILQSAPPEPLKAQDSPAAETLGAPDPEAQAAWDTAKAEIDAKANEAATSAANDLPQPTDAQKEAGNYKKGHISLHGMDIAIENPLGSERKGVDAGGQPWSVTMPAHYGYVKGSKGKDGDHVDVYVGPNPASDKVFVVDQLDLKTGKFDEHKAVMGADSREAAQELYQAGFSDGKGAARIGAITEMSASEFKAWVSDEKATKKPLAYVPGQPAAMPEDFQKNGQTRTFRNQAAAEAYRSARGKSMADYQARETPNGWVLSRNPAPVAKTVKSQSDARAESRGLQTPDDVDVADFIARAAEKGISEEVARELAPRTLRDDVTGFYDARAGGLKAKVIERAIQHAKETGRESHLMVFDVANLGGLNESVGNDSARANAHFRAISDFTEARLRASGADVIPMRTGGDEFMSVVAGISQADLDRAKEGIRKDVQAYVKAEKLDQIPNPKGKAPGLGLHFSSSPISQSGTVGSIIKDAERQLKAAGKETGNERGKQPGAAGIKQPEGAGVDRGAAGQEVSAGVRPASRSGEQGDGSGMDQSGARATGGQVDATAQAPAASQADIPSEPGQASRPDRPADAPEPAQQNSQEVTQANTETSPADAGLSTSTPVSREQGLRDFFQNAKRKMPVYAIRNADGEIVDWSTSKKAMDAKLATEQKSGALPDARVDLIRAANQIAQTEKPKDAPPAAKPSPKPAEPASPTIADFGEKILGARKDAMADYAERLKIADKADIRAVALSVSWPEPDYKALIDAGADPKRVAWARALRDDVATKPVKPWKLAGWAGRVKILRDIAKQVMDGDFSKTAAMNDIKGRAELYQEIGHDASLKGVRFGEHHYSLYKGEENVKKWVVEKKAKATAFSNWPTELGVGNTRDEAIASFKANLEALKTEKPQTEFVLYTRRNSTDVVIGKKIGKNYVDLKTFPNIKEARAWKNANQDTLEKMWAKVKEVQSERRPENSPRVGVDHRNGADVTPAQFSETFGFRGVQFGNYVEGPKRQADLNQAFDALMDLAGVLNVPPRSLSLNGELGLAFGARGHGGKKAPLAHYERSNVVINLTKHGGAGSLAHEWFHGMDNYFSRMGGMPNQYVTDGNRVSMPGVRPEMMAAFRSLMNALMKSGMLKRSETLDQTRSKAYWSTRVEMAARAFESYVIAKLQDQNASNDYLANIVGEKAWSVTESRKESYPYPTESEMPAVRAAFDKFFNTVETQETDKGVALMADNRAGVWPGFYIAAEGKESSEQAAAKASRLTGIPLTLPVVEVNDAARIDAPMWLDSGAPQISVNTAVPQSPAATLQAMTEELAHHLDVVGPGRSIAASSLRYAPGGDLRAEVEAAVQKSAALKDFLAYPLMNKGPGEIMLTPRRIKAELFARLLTVYHGQTQLRSVLPKNFEVFDGLQDAIREGNITGRGVSGEVRQGGAADQVRGGQRAEPRARGADEAGRGDGGRARLERGRAYLAKAIAGSLRGASVESSFDSATKTQAPPSEGLVVSAKPAAETLSDIGGMTVKTVRAALADTLDRLDVPVRIVAGPEQARAMGLAAESGVAGLATSDTIVLIASGIRSPRHAQFVLWHEAFHAGFRRQNPSRAEYDAALRDIAGKNPKLRQEAAAWRVKHEARWMGRFAELGYTPQEAAEDVQLLSIEEALADRSGEVGGVLKLNGWSQFVAAIQRLLRKIGLNDLASWIESRTGAETLSLIVAARDAAAGKVPQVPATLVPAQSMPARGMVPQTETEAFKRWFSESKVVDSEGKPLVVYHGSRTGGFSEFKQGAGEPIGYKDKQGFYFSPDAEYAGDYGTSVIPAYLSIKNPYRAPRDGFEHTYISPARKAELVSKGFDGVMFEGDADGRYPPEYVAFYPNQIKSAVGNNGNFDPASASIVESRSADFEGGRRRNADGSFSADYVLDDPPKVKRKIVEILRDRFDSTGTFNLWDKTVGTPFHQAWKDADFRRVYEAANNFIEDVSLLAVSAADMAPTLLPKMETVWSAIRPSPLKKVDEQSISKALLRGTVEEVVYATAEDAKLTNKQFSAYQEARAAVNRSLEDTAVSNIFRSLLVHNIKLDLRESGMLDAHRLAKAALAERKAAEQQAVDAARSEMTAIRDQWLKKADGPEKRELDIKGMQAATRLVAAQRRLQQVVRTTEDIDALVDRITDLQAKGYFPLMRWGKHTLAVYQNDKVEFFGMFESLDERNAVARAFKAEMPAAKIVRGEASQNGYEMFRGVNPESLQALVEAAGESDSGIFEQYIRMAASNHSAMKRLLRRKTIPGFSPDVTRALAAFITSNARLASRNFHMREAMEAFEAIPKEKGDVMDQAAKLLGYLQNPGEEANFVRGMLFHWFLGGNVSSALINMMQPVQTTISYLSQYGTVNASAAVTSALPKVYRKSLWSQALTEAIGRAEQYGVTAPHEIHMLQAEATRSFGSNTAVRTFTRVWGSFFAVAEAFNRKLSFIAAFEMASKALPAINQVRAKRGESQFATPYDFAADTVRQTQFVYGKQNRPQWARGPIGSVLFTFKQFSISMLEFISRLPPQQKMMVLGCLVVLSGLEGLPFAEDLEDLIDTIGQSLGYDTNSKEALRRAAVRYLGKDGGKFIVNGVSGLGLPLDVQGRFGMGNLIPGTGVFKRSNTAGASTREASQVFGPVGGLFQQFADALDAWQAGNSIDKILAQLAPVAVKNFVKGLEMGSTGWYRDAKGRNVVPATERDAYVKGVGFQPGPIADQREAERIQLQNINLAKNVEADFAEAIARAAFNNDHVKLQEAIQRLNDWNKNNPQTPIQITRQQIKRRIQEMNKTSAERLYKSAPREMRGATVEAVQKQ